MGRYFSIHSRINADWGIIPQCSGKWCSLHNRRSKTLVRNRYKHYVIINGYIKKIYVVADDCGLTVIPLVQTFGHLEYVLKHDQWKGLREVESFPSSICPSNSETMPLIRSMIKQIVAFHPNIQYLHIGADEVV